MKRIFFLCCKNPNEIFHMVNFVYAKQNLEYLINWLFLSVQCMGCILITSVMTKIKFKKSIRFTRIWLRFCLFQTNTLAQITFTQLFTKYYTFNVLSFLGFFFQTTCIWWNIHLVSLFKFFHIYNNPFGSKFYSSFHRHFLNPCVHHTSFHLYWLISVLSRIGNIAAI